jgi:CubicO group peptidase (beta-lactamase class C family)
MFGESPPIAEAASELGVSGGPPRSPGEELGSDEWLRRLGTLPLVHQPGTRWMYNTGSEILGILLARVTGRPLGEVLRERVFAPLGMADTGFAVPPGGVHRLPPSYFGDAYMTQYDAGGAASRWATEPARPSCGGGLVSTADDVLAFARMLLDGGSPVLAPTSVRAMTTDQLRPEQKPWGDVFGAWWESHGWGFGTAVATRAVSPWQSVGQHGWDGGLGTSYRVDPAEGLIAILLTQLGAFPLESPVYLDFWAATYAALGA